MMSIRRIVSIAVLLLSLASPTHATWLQPATATVSAEQVGAWMPELIGLVERIAGKSFASAPSAVVVDRDQIVEQLRADLRPLVRVGDPRLTTGELDVRTQRRALDAAPQVLAHPVADPARILVATRHLQPLLDLVGVSDAHGSGVLRLAIVHALTLELIDQHTSMRQDRADPLTAGAWQAQAAVRNGFAALVRRRAAAELSLNDAEASLAAIMRLDGIVQVPADLTEHLELIHAAGDVFIAHHETIGGMTRLWGILAEPPPVVAHVRDPRSYGSRVTTTFSHARLFRGIREMMLTPTWRQRTRQVQPSTIGRSFSPLGTTVTSEITGMISRGFSLFCTDGDSRLYTFTLAELVRPDDAPALVDRVKQLADEQFGELRNRATGSLLADEHRSESLPNLEADHVSIGHCRLTEPTPGTPPVADVIIGAACRGGRVLQVVGHSAPIDDPLIGQAMATIFDRLESDDARVPTEPILATGPLDRALETVRSAVGGDAWTFTQNPATIESVSSLIGPDGKAMLKLGFTDARTCVLADTTAPGNARTLITSLVEMSGPEFADLLCRAMAASADVALARFAEAGADIVPDTNEDRHLPGSIDLSTRAVKVRFVQQPERRVTVYAARRGPFVVYMLDMNDTISTPEMVEATMTGIFAELP